MPQLEPTAAEIGEVVAEIQRGYRLKRTSEARNLPVDGFIPGVDAPGEVVDGEFRPAGDPAKHPNWYRDAPWWMILTLEDLGRHVAAIEAQRANAERMAAQWKAEQKRLEARINHVVNYYAEDIIPPCPEGQQSKTTRCPITGGAYRVQPARAPQFRLVSRAEASEHGLLKPHTSMVALSSSELHTYAAAHGWSIPGYEVEHQQPVSYSPPKAATGIPDAPELEPPQE
jgi:hypothetical protein